MIDKVVDGLSEALAGISDGASVLVSGFGDAGAPFALLEHLATMGLSRLCVISNNAGSGDRGLARLLAAGSVGKIICSYPRSPGSVVFDKLYAEGMIELELCPQGTLSERIRAGGAGIAAFYTPTGADSELTRDREHRVFEGRSHVLEHAISADFALIRGERADRWGNVVYRKAARNFGPTMAMAGRICIVEVREIVRLGALDPEAVVTPGIFVQRVVAVP